MYQILVASQTSEWEHPLHATCYQMIKNQQYDALEHALQQHATLFDAQCNIKTWQIKMQDKFEPTVIGSDFPSGRAGTPFAHDTQQDAFYMFGGYSGQKDLDDLWIYYARTNTWQQVGQSSPWPVAKSCHQLVHDAIGNKLYLLGKYTDHAFPLSQLVQAIPFKSDLWSFDCFTHQWTCLSQDTELEYGPPLLFHHQMCIMNRTLYVFGGRYMTSSCKTAILNEKLYMYDLESKSWSHFKDALLKPRAEHCMVGMNGKLYIFGGQRYFRDFVK